MASVFNDNFTGANGTNLTAHTPDSGGTWSAIGGAILIQNNRAYVSTAGNYYSGTAPGPDYKIDVTFFFASLSYNDLSFYGRMATSGDTGMALRMSAGGVINCFSVVGGALGQTNGNYTIPGGISVGQTITVTLEMKGNQIKVWYNGAVVISATDNHVLTGNNFGFRGSGASTSTTGTHIDAVTVYYDAVYWVGGSGNINSTAHWAGSSGGSAASGYVPGQTTDVFVDGNSGSPTITVNSSPTFKSLSLGTGGFLPPTANITLNFNSGLVISLLGNYLTGIGTVVNHSGASGFSFLAPATLECLGSAALGTVIIDPGAGNQIQFSTGESGAAGSFYFTGYNFTDLTHTSGTIVIPSAFALTPGDYEYTYFFIGAYHGSNSNVRGFDFGALGGGLTAHVPNIEIGSLWDITTTTNYTITHGGSSTNNGFIFDAGVTFNSGGLTGWPGVNFSGSATVTGNTTFDYFGLNGTAPKGLVTFTGNVTSSTLVGSPGLAFLFQGNSTITTASSLSGTGITFTPGKTNSWGLGTNLNGSYMSNVAVLSATPGTAANWTITSPTTATVSWWLVRDIVMTGSTITIYRGTNGGDNSATFVFVTGFQKYYIYDVYTYAGSYVGQYTDVTTDPDIQQEINSTGGQLIIRRGVDPTNFGEGTLVDYNNNIQVRVFSEDFPTGQIIFNGFISQYVPNFEPANQFVEITCLPYGAEFSQYYAVVDPTKDASTNVLPSQQSNVAATTGNTTTGWPSKFAQKFTTGASATNLAQINFTAAWSGTALRIRIYTDTGGAPDSGSLVGTVTQNGISYWQNPNTGVVNFYNAFYNAPIIPAITLSANTAYWYVVDSTGTDVFGGTFPLVQPAETTSSGTGVSANIQIFTASWAAVSGQYFMFENYTSLGNTTVPYSTNLLSAIQDVINNYRTLGGHVNFTGTSLDPALSSTTISYTFQTNTVLECIQKFLDLAPSGYYWYVDPATSILYFLPKATTPKHYFTLGKDISKIQLEKTMETVINDFLITGGPTGGVNLFRRYLNITSIGRYGRRQSNYNDTNLTSTTTADLIGTKYVTQWKNPQQRAPVEVLGQPDSGYPIENIRVGDTFAVIGKNDTTLAILQISRYDYLPYVARLDATEAPPQLTNIVQDIEGSLDNTQTSANPSAPTYVAVP